MVAIFPHEVWQKVAYIIFRLTPWKITSKVKYIVINKNFIVMISVPFPPVQRASSPEQGSQQSQAPVDACPACSWDWTVHLCSSHCPATDDPSKPDGESTKLEQPGSPQNISSTSQEFDGNGNMYNKIRLLLQSMLDRSSCYFYITK